MKKIIYSIALLFAMSITNEAFSQMKIAATAGLNFANGKTEAGGTTETSDSRTAIFLGAIGEMPITDDIYFQTGLIYSGKGGKENFGGTTVTSKINYLDIPLKALYKFELGSLMAYGSAGPYLAYCLGGKYDGGGGTVDVNVGSSDTDDIKALDFGFGIGAGVELEAGDKPLQVGFSYDFGLANVAPQSGVTAKVRVFSLRAAYFLFGN